MSELSALLKDARLQAGLTQAQLALRLGVSQAAVAKLERPDANPTIATLTEALRMTGHRLTLNLEQVSDDLDESLIRQQLELPPRLRGLEQPDPPLQPYIHSKRTPKLSAEQLRRIIDRDNHKCVLCRSKEDLTVDHALPVEEGGTSKDSNLRALCNPCCQHARELRMAAREALPLPTAATGVNPPLKPYIYLSRAKRNRSHHRRERQRRQHLLERDGNKCVLCRVQKNLTLDHILPISEGGTNQESNLRILCEPCNQSAREDRLAARIALGWFRDNPSYKVPSDNRTP